MYVCVYVCTPHSSGHRRTHTDNNATIHSNTAEHNGMDAWMGRAGTHCRVLLLSFFVSQSSLSKKALSKLSPSRSLPQRSLSQSSLNALSKLSQSSLKPLSPQSFPLRFVRFFFFFFFFSVLCFRRCLDGQLHEFVCWRRALPTCAWF